MAPASYRLWAGLLASVSAALLGGCSGSQASAKPATKVAASQPAAKSGPNSKAVAKQRSLHQRIDALRKEHKTHIDELRRLEGCGLYLCERLPKLADRLAHHRKLAALPAACQQLNKQRSLYVAYALKPKKLTPVKRQKAPHRDRVVDCRLVLDGERILRTQIVATATWQARIGADFIEAPIRYDKQGRISAHLAGRITGIGRERRWLRDQLQPIFKRTGVTVPDDELFEALGKAVHAFEEAVQQRQETSWILPLLDDKRFARQVSKLFVSQARLDGVAYKAVDGIGVLSGTWQKHTDRAGRIVRRTRRAEIALRVSGKQLCRFREVVAYRHDRGAYRSRAVKLWISDEVRFARCPSATSASESAATPGKAMAPGKRSVRTPRG